MLALLLLIRNMSCAVVFDKSRLNLWAICGLAFFTGSELVREVGSSINASTENKTGKINLSMGD